MSNLVAMKCDMCGAPLPESGSMKCDYCGTVYTFRSRANLVSVDPQTGLGTFQDVPYIGVASVGTAHSYICTSMISFGTTTSGVN